MGPAPYSRTRKGAQANGTGEHNATVHIRCAGTVNIYCTNHRQEGRAGRRPSTEPAPVALRGLRAAQNRPAMSIQSTSDCMRSSCMTCHINGGSSLPEGARERSIRLSEDDPVTRVLHFIGQILVRSAEGVRKPATWTVDQVRKGVMHPGTVLTV